MNTDSEGRCWYQKRSGSVCSPRGGFSYSQQSEHSWSRGDSVLYELDLRSAGSRLDIKHCDN